MKRFSPILLCAALAITPAMAQENSGQIAEMEEDHALQAAQETANDPDGLLPVPMPASDSEMRDIDPALWVIRDADTTIYLFGTVHVLKPGLGWFDEAVKEAFDKSDTLIVEVVEPPAGEMQAIFAKYALAADGVPLRKRLSAQDLAAYNTAVKQTGLGHSVLDPLDPWAVAVTLQLIGLVASGYDPESGVDTQLEAAAKASGKTIGQVETAAQQLGFFDNLSMETQLEFLKQTTADMAASAGQLDQLVEYWGNGDVDRLAKLINAGFSDPELYRILLTKRNANWAAWIKQRMEKPGTVFMAVGAGHLAGGASLQNMLGAYGITAQRVNY